MTDVSYQLQLLGVESVQHKLQTLEQISRHLGPPMMQSLAVVQRDIARYPRKSKGAFSALATPKQKRAFWAKVKADPSIFDARTGYRRTGTFGRKWTSEAQISNSHVRGILGNNTPYGPFVQGVPGQQPFHKASGWKTTDEVFKKNQRKIQNFFAIAIKQLIEG